MSEANGFVHNADDNPAVCNEDVNLNVSSPEQAVDSPTQKRSSDHLRSYGYIVKKRKVVEATESAEVNELAKTPKIARRVNFADDHGRALVQTKYFYVDFSDDADYMQSPKETLSKTDSALKSVPVEEFRLFRVFVQNQKPRGHRSIEAKNEAERCRTTLAGFYDPSRPLNLTVEPSPVDCAPDPNHHITVIALDQPSRVAQIQRKDSPPRIPMTGASVIMDDDAKPSVEIPEKLKNLLSGLKNSGLLATSQAPTSAPMPPVYSQEGVSPVRSAVYAQEFFPSPGNVYVSATPTIALETQRQDEANPVSGTFTAQSPNGPTSAFGLPPPNGVLPIRPKALLQQPPSYHNFNNYHFGGPQNRNSQFFEPNNHNSNYQAPRPPRVPFCRQFARGHCQYGERCRYDHVPKERLEAAGYRV